MLRESSLPFRKRIIFPCSYYTYRNREARIVATGNIRLTRRRWATRGSKKGYKNSINFAILINSIFIWRDKQKLPPTRQFRLIPAIVRWHRLRCANLIFTRHASFFPFRFRRWFQLPFARLQEIKTRDKDTEKRVASFLAICNSSFYLISQSSYIKVHYRRGNWKLLKLDIHKHD